MGAGEKHKRPRNARTANWKLEEKKIFLDLVLEYMPEVCPCDVTFPTLQNMPTDSIWEEIAKTLQERSNSAIRRTIGQCKV